MLKMARLTLLALSLTAAAGTVSHAVAAEELTVLADQSQVIKLDRAPSTIVVGNPSIADVTIQGSQLFVHGRLFGKTNIIILDDNGSAMAEYNVNVGGVDDHAITVFKGMTGSPIVLQSSFTCKSDCEAVLRIGDDPDEFKKLTEQQKNKLGIAQGQKSGESNSPGTPDQSQ